MVTSHTTKFRNDDGSTTLCGIYVIGNQQYAAAFDSTGDVRCARLGASKGEEHAESLPKYIQHGW